MGFFDAFRFNEKFRTKIVTWQVFVLTHDVLTKNLELKFQIVTWTSLDVIGAISGQHSMLFVYYPFFQLQIATSILVSRIVISDTDR